MVQTRSDLASDTAAAEETSGIRLTPTAIDVLHNRYLRKNARGEIAESPEGLFRRVASAVADAERLAGGEQDVAGLTQQFYDLMASFDFLPNSPTLMNAGTDLGQLSACFVLPVEDDLSHIFEMVKLTALIHQSGGGTGFSFSRLRPNGDMVRSTGGIASGPVSFMRAFDTGTDVIKQGGRRRGANMAVLRVDHPDILEFIDCKHNEHALNNFNISVGITASFMGALEGETEFTLVNPRTRAPSRQLPAQAIFERVVQSAWLNGEPGLIFLDRMNEFNPTPQLGEYESTNPCVTGDTWVMTTEGARQVKDLIEHPFTAVANGAEWPSEGFFSTGTKQVYKLTTVEGISLRLTGEHPLLKVTALMRYRLETEWAKTQDLQPGDQIVIHNHRNFLGWEGAHTEAEGYLMGFFLGDGTINDGQIILSSWGESDGAKAVRGVIDDYVQKMPHRSDFVGWCAISGRNEYRLALAALRRLASELGIDNSKVITPQMERASADFYRGLLRGLFDTDGSVQGTQRKGVSVRLAQSDFDMLRIAQRMLLRLGIASKIYRNRRQETMQDLPDGKGGTRKYPTKAQHELIIASDNLFYFHERVGFNDTDKAHKLTQALHAYQREINRERFVVTIAEIAPDGMEGVYDVRIPGINLFDANGLAAHNCGEQVLLPYESCNLGSINLSHFVVEGPAIDWSRLERVAKLATHFLDNVIGINRYPLDVIRRATLATRKVGLGVMGFAEMLFQLGISYDSEDAERVARKVMEAISYWSKEQSCQLAASRGSFPSFPQSRYAEGWLPVREDLRESPAFPAQLAKRIGDAPIFDWEALSQTIVGSGLRNATTTTIAPTGSIGIIAGTSGGIEPVFALSFKRSNILDKTDEYIEVNPYLLQAVERAGIPRETLDEVLVRGTCQLEGVPREVQRVFVTAHDIAPEWHIRIQAAFQNYTDNAVSKTINFPEHATIEDVRRAFLLAYHSGCKGITVYRDGSRKFQVLQRRDSKGGKAMTTPATSPEISITHDEPLKPRTRPAITVGFTEKVSLGCGQKLYITVNEDEHGLFEVFGRMGKSGGCMSAHSEALGRLISISIRSGVDVSEIIRTLRGIRCPAPSLRQGGYVLSCADAIGQALERYQKSRERGVADLGAIAEEKDGNGHDPAELEGLAISKTALGSCPECPECGSLLEFAEGCVLCRVCGFSRCG